MATQSLYRRYRPRRFADLKGQDHVVRALRTSVAEGREGQAYLFSGPRGTGKTSSARILAKVLNCENPQGGEPCCECASCLAVEQGTSYDVHELDAASNNGVDAMRDLIEKASLGTPGRHKVYILDEVHMLSKGAEAALLKTLEEPPPHVVFVLATTDPQKMSDTIRSRTQHLQFHLLPADTLDEHARWVAVEAGLDVSDDALEQAVAQGAGSARDTLSALELVANAGGDAAEVIALDDFVEAMIEHDPGRALTMAAHAISRGRDPRTLTEELVGHLRNGFLALMAPELVQLPSTRIEAVTDQARRLGPPGLVRGIEQLGSALTEMRHAPDPRVLLDVAIVQLTSEQVAGDLASVVDRLARLERRVADGVPTAAAAPTAGESTTPTTAATTSATPAAPAPSDPATGRKTLGGRARRGADETPASAPAAAVDAGDTTEAVPGNDTDVDAGVPAEPEPADPPQPAAPAPAVTAEPAPSGPTSEVVPTAEHWEQVRAGLKGMARAVFAPAEFVEAASGSVTLRLPNDTHRQKCEQHRAAVEQALTSIVGDAVALELVTGGSGPGDGPGRGSGPSGAGGGLDEAVTTAASTPAERGPRAAGPNGGASAAMAAAVAAVADDEPMPDADDTPRLQSVPDVPSAASGRAIADAARAAGPESDGDEVAAVPLAELPDDDEVDLDDLVDAPPEAVRTPMDRLAEAFPGSELVDDVL